MKKEYSLFYRPEKENFEMYYEGTPDEFDMISKTKLDLETEITVDELEIIVNLYSKDERIFKKTVFGFPKQAAFNPELSADIKLIHDKGKIEFFYTINKSDVFKKEFTLKERDMDNLLTFLELK